jgi:queuine tRNA-ribosyltransferase
MARPTVLETAHGPLRLPAYFPDATRAVVRTVDSRDLEACGVQGLVVNVFHLSTRPGAGLIKQAGGVHSFMDWTRPIASDSGGFQLMSMIRQNARYGTISRRGIHFVDFDGKRDKVLFTPERSIRQQFDLGTDLIICLDDCPSPEATPQEVATSVDWTIHWAERCRAEFDRQVAIRNKEGGTRPLLFGVIQGGYDKEQRTRCAEGLLPLGFDGFGYGGWPLMPEGDLLAWEILAHTSRLVPRHLPGFALGVGKPEHIVFLTAYYPPVMPVMGGCTPSQRRTWQRWMSGLPTFIDLSTFGTRNTSETGDRSRLFAIAHVARAIPWHTCIIFLI